MVATWDIQQGDCRVLLRQMQARGIRFDSCVTDAPYEINFMAKRWDNTGIAFETETWRAVYDVLKPGAYLVAFGGCRSHHRMWCAIEDAGFTIIDTLMWLFGSGMPKSHNVSLSIDKSQGAPRADIKVIMRRRPMIGHMDEVKPGIGKNWFKNPEIHIPDRNPITDDAKQWNGFGTGLKPSYEPIILAQRPRDGTIVQNIQNYGTGAMNIDVCRIGETKRVPGSISRTPNKIYGNGLGGTAQDLTDSGHDPNVGRWPANIVHDGSDEVEAAFAKFGERSSGAMSGTYHNTIMANRRGQRDGAPIYLEQAASTGSASRFFFTAKADTTDRAWSRHSTVKPLDLMHWLVRLVTPPGGTIIDPFCGSGTSLQAAVEQGFNAIGCEITPEYIADIERRMATFCGWYNRKATTIPRRPLPNRRV